MPNVNAKFLLRIDTYENWTNDKLGEGKGALRVLDRGEIGLCEIPAKRSNDPTVQTPAPTVLFKVGDGTKKFSELNWASALAADVYDWAKVEGGQVFAKDGTGNVISGITYDATLNGGKGGFKYTTASVATSEGLEELQKDVAAIEKDIADNRDAWAKYEDTRYTFSTDGDKLVVKKALYTNGVAGAEETVGTYEFLTETEVGTLISNALKNYYTKGEADAKFAPIGIDTGVHSVALAGGTNNGTLKLTVDGTATDNIKVTGLGDAAYTTVKDLNDTASGYVTNLSANLEQGQLIVKKAESDASGNVITTTYETKNDATGKLNAAKQYTNEEIAKVLGASTDAATANTVYGAKAAAAAAQNDATIAKTKIETFLGTVTPDGSQDIIDTLAEINTYVGEHGEEFAALSGRVTKVENGETVVAKAAADGSGNNIAETYATKTEVSNLSANIEQGTVVAGKAIADGNGNNIATTYAKEADLGDLAKKDNITASLVTDFATEVAKVKVTNADHADSADAATKATQDASGNVITETYATKTEVSNLSANIEQGSIKAGKAIADENGNNISATYAKTADIQASLDKANSAFQAAAADTPQTVGNLVSFAGKGLLDDTGIKASDVSAAMTNANSAIQSVTGTNGVKATKNGTAVTVEIDTATVFVFNGGSATSEW